MEHAIRGIGWSRMPKGDWVCVRFKREFWDCVMRPLLERVCNILGLDMESKSHRVTALEGMMSHLSSMSDEELEASIIGKEK